VIDGQNETSGTPGKPNLARLLKQLRLAKGLSLNELAAVSGLARSTLYKVENSGMSLTYDKLLSLSAGLGVEIGALFHEPAGNTELPAFIGRRQVGRQGEGDLVPTQNYDYLYLCNELVQKDLIPMIGRVKTRTIEEYGPMVGHPGQEFTFVLDGSIEVVTQLYRAVTLNKGDFIYLDSPMPHAFLCTSKEPATVLTVCSSPEHSHGKAAAVSPPQLLESKPLSGNLAAKRRLPRARARSRR
jgi:transcriptional regulator with XRE-family HTH domain